MKRRQMARDNNNERGAIPQYTTRTTQLVVVEECTQIHCDTDTAQWAYQKAYMRIEEHHNGRLVSVIQWLVDPAEWPAIRDAVEKLIQECRNYE